MTIESLWMQYGEQLRRRARTRLRQYGLCGQAESMDICNDVMADLAKQRPADTLSCDDVLAYVMRAIDHQVLDTFRTLARQCRDFRRVQSLPDDLGKRIALESTPSQVALRREVLDKIRSLLNDQDRQALEMMLENRDWNEIGEAIGMRPDTIRMRVRRALSRVRSEFGLSGDGHE
jgi:RNA polymerase sigma factor (sigma-70 family)